LKTADPAFRADIAVQPPSLVAVQQTL